MESWSISSFVWVLGMALVPYSGLAASPGQHSWPESQSVSLSDVAATIDTLVSDLRSKSKMPVCFIHEPSSASKLHLTFGSGALQDLLSEVRSQAPEYEWRVFDRRLLILPAQPRYDYLVEGVAIKDQPRLDAADQLVALLNSRYPEFADLLPPPMLGSSSHPTYADRVTLSTSGRVIELLAQLLGSDRTLFFSIVPARTGLPELVLDRVPQE